MRSFHHGLGWLVAASAATFLLTFFPLARIISYPFQILSTFLHETCHALAAVFTFGRVEGLTVSWNGSGVTFTSGGIRPIIYSAGYIGTAFWGGGLLLLSGNQKWVRPALAAFTLLVALATVSFTGRTNNLLVLSGLLAIFVFLWASFRLPAYRFHTLSGAGVVLILLVAYLLLTGSLFSWSVGLAATAGLLGVLRFASLPVAHFFLSFLAIQCSLNSLEALRMLYFISTGPGCKATDAAHMASLTGIPAVLWSVLWATIALGILGFSLWQMIRRGKST